MTGLALALLGAVVLLGTAGQVCLKLALHPGGGVSRGGVPPAQLLRSPLLWAWFGSYVVTLAIWLLVLRNMPLSQAFPALGLTFALVPLSSALLLKETVSPVQWVGIAVIIAGVGLVLGS